MSAGLVETTEGANVASAVPSGRSARAKARAQRAEKSARHCSIRIAVVVDTTTSPDQRSVETATDPAIHVFTSPIRSHAATGANGENGARSTRSPAKRARSSLQARIGGGRRSGGRYGTATARSASPLQPTTALTRADRRAATAARAGAEPGANEQTPLLSRKERRSDGANGRAGVAKMTHGMITGARLTFTT